MAVNERELAQQLKAQDFDVGVSKNGRLLRIDHPSGRSNIDASLWDQILACSALRELTLRGVSSFPPDAVERMARLPRLRHLDVEGSSGWGDDELRQLAECPALQVLNVRGTRVSQATVSELRKVMIGTRIIH